MFKRALLWGALIAFGAALGPWLRLDAAVAQLTPPPGGIKRSILQKTDVPGTNLETIVALRRGSREFPSRQAYASWPSHRLYRRG